MNHNEVIKFPILSEKTYSQMSNHVYTFAVDKRTNKSEVKKVVEFIFDVKVAKVNIFTVPKKPKKLGRFEGFTNGYKKAIVTLKEGAINIFPEEEVEETKKTAPKETKEDTAAATAAEKKAADKIAAKLAEKETTAKAEAPKKEEVKAEVKEETKKPVEKTEENK